MSHNLNCVIPVIGIDIGKNSFRIVGLDERGPEVTSKATLRNSRMNPRT